jgi:hypothetical protein
MERVEKPDRQQLRLAPKKRRSLAPIGEIVAASGRDDDIAEAR